MGSSLEGGKSGSQDNVAVQALLEVQASAASLGGGDVRSLEGSPAGHRSAFTDVAGLLKE